MSILDLLNPLFVIIVHFYIISSYILKGDVSSYTKEYFLFPFIAYFIFFFIVVLLSKYKNQRKAKLTSIVFRLNFKFILVIMIFSIIVDCVTLLMVIKTVGLKVTPSSIYYFQVTNPAFIKLPRFILQVCPIIIVCYEYSYSELKKRKKIIFYIFILLNTIISFLIGSRFLILYLVTPILFRKYAYKKIDVKNCSKIFFILIIAISFMIYGQSVKVREQNKDVKHNTDVLTKYYSMSIENGLRVIEYRYEKLNPYYWTIYRPLFSLPKVKKIGLAEYYEKHIGVLPIKDRADDFYYAEKLGANTQYNTFSLWGYSYLDFGYNGWIVVFINFCFIQLLYWKAKKSKGHFFIMYPIYYLSLLDQVRTNGIFNTGIIYFNLCYFILVLLRIIVKSKNVKI